MRCSSLRRREWVVFTVLMLIAATERSIVVADGDTSTPSIAPSAPRNITAAPSDTPTNASVAPSIAPSASPSAAPTNIKSEAPTLAPNVTVAPTSEPTSAPSFTPTEAPKKKHSSIGRIIGKTIGYLILMFLSVLFFGAIMSNRYRIYYVLRGVWYTVRQMQCTQWIMQKLRFRRGPPSGGAPLNDIIFDPGDLSEGLLMSQNGNDV